MIRERIISGIVIAAVLILLAISGGVPLGLFAAACGMIGYYELSKALGVFANLERMNGPAAVGMLGTAVFYAVLIVTGSLLEQRAMISAVSLILPTAVIMLFLAEMTVFVFTYPAYKAPQVVGAVFAFLYASVLMSFVYLTRLLPYGILFFAMIFFCSSICDVCAWAVGRKIGRHRLAPILSPKKSVEGAIGGVVGSTLICLITAGIVELVIPGSHLFLMFLVMGPAGSIISQIGDLAASGIKRSVGLKDYGNLIPGHGGIMDRFDSVLFTAPVIYLLAVLFLYVF